MALKLIEGPGDLAISLERVKQHLRVDGAEQDELITLYLKAAIRLVDGPSYMGVCLKPQTWDLILDEFPCEGNGIEIPLSPLIEVVSITYQEGSPDLVVSPADYVVDTASRIGRIVPVSSFAWPAADDVVNAVRIRFRAGHPDTEDSPPESTVPENIQLALLLMVADAYEFRETVAEGAAVAVPMSTTVQNLLQRDRIYR